MREQGASDDELRAVAARAEAFFLSTWVACVERASERIPHQHMVSSHLHLHSQAEPDLQQPQPHEALVPASLAPSHPQQPASESDPSRASFTDATSPQSPSNAPSAADDPPYPPTFAELAQMIATGAPVPGIRDIPDLLAEGKPSESTAQVPKKPWERAGDGVPADAMSDS